MSKSVKAAFTPSTDNLTFANGIVQSLDALSVRRQQWETTDYKKANDGLYALLAECLDVFQSKFINADDDSRKTLRKELCARLSADGVKVQSNSATLTMFVRFVFSSDRKRAHGYAYVLAAAVSHDVQSSNLPVWIAEQGGIEEIKRRMVKTAEAIARAQRVVTAHSIVTAEIEQATITPLATADLALSGEYAVLLAKPSPDGTVAIVGALPNASDAMVNALRKCMARQRAASAEESAQLGKEAQDLLAGRDGLDSALAYAA